MKKILAILLLLLISVFLFSCKSKNKTYVLDYIYAGWFDEQFKYGMESFEKEYPHEIEKIGDKIIIKDSKYIVFNGKVTKDLSGEIEMVTFSDFESFITFKEKYFYTYYPYIHIMYGELYITSHDKIINDKPVNFAFAYKLKK